MRYILYFSILILLNSCNNSNSAEQSVKQDKIDSLIAELNKRDETAKKLEDDKQKQVEQKKKRATELAIKQRFANARNSVLEMVTTDKPRFYPVDFGGFKNISYTFFNDYDHKLDQVIMTVHYVKRNGSDAKSETVILRDVEPRSRQTIRPPDYLAAGTYIRVTFESIQCKELDLCYFGRTVPHPKDVMGKSDTTVGNGLFQENLTSSTNTIYDPYKCN